MGNEITDKYILKKLNDLNNRKHTKFNGSKCCS
jgi:hypothetical protein